MEGKGAFEVYNEEAEIDSFSKETLLGSEEQHVDTILPSQKETKQKVSIRDATFAEVKLEADRYLRTLEVHKVDPQEVVAEAQELSNVFKEYELLVNEIGPDLEIMVAQSATLFHFKNVDENKIHAALLGHAQTLLENAMLHLQSWHADVPTLQRLAQEIRTEKELKKKIIEEFIATGHQLNAAYEELDSIDDNLSTLKEFREWQIELESQPGGMDARFKTEMERQKRYDSDRLKMMIEHYTNQYALSPDQEEALAMIQTPEQIARIKTQMEKDRSRYQPLVEKLKKALRFQVAFEKKFENLLYGTEPVTLKKEVLADLPELTLEEEVKEKIPEQAPLYFPVGISKDMVMWEQVLNGEKQALKPVDIYGYLLWLENQGRPAKLVVCDEIQTSNYTALYGVNKDQARDAAQRIGQAEAEFYKKIITTFDLKNVELVNYQEFQADHAERTLKYKKLVRELVHRPLWREAALAMVQESVKKNGESSEKYLAYAVEELVWIVATDGTKVSHVNEARYDALAAVIKNTITYFENQGIDSTAVTPEEFDRAAKVAVAVLKDELNRQKGKQADKDGDVYHYYVKAYEQVGRIKDDSKQKIDKAEKKLMQELCAFNFCVPTTTGRSMGWRSVGVENIESSLSFKEPYSTYFVDRGSQDLFLESEQVVASPTGNIGGKVLTLESDKQLRYVEQVIKPMLVQFFKVLSKFSPENTYFSQVYKKNPEEIMAECMKAATLSDLLSFVQDYVVAPSSGIVAGVEGLLSVAG